MLEVCSLYTVHIILPFPLLARNDPEQVNAGQKDRMWFYLCYVRNTECRNTGLLSVISIGGY